MNHNARIDTKSMGATLLLWVSLMLSASGCQPPPEHQRIAQAFEQLKSAIETEDAGLLFDLSDPELHIQIQSLHEQLAEAEATIDSFYPPQEAEALRSRLALKLLERATAPRALFIALADFSGLNRNTEAEKGLSLAEMTIHGREARVKTQAGEVFRFVLDSSGDWKTTAGLRAFEAWSGRQALIENLNQLSKNIEAMQAQIHSLRNPKTPEGAFNVIREAALVPNLDAIYTLLDQSSRRLLDKLARSHQTPRRSRRYRRRAPQAPPSPAVSAANTALNGRQLLENLWTAQLAQQYLPATSTDRIDNLEQMSPKEVLITTPGLKQIKMTQEGDGRWRLEGFGDWVSAQLKP